MGSKDAGIMSLVRKQPELKEFTNIELICVICGTSKVKILKPEWI